MQTIASPATLRRCRGPLRRSRSVQHTLCRHSATAAGRDLTRLPKGGSANLVLPGLCTWQDLFDPTSSRGTNTAVGWTGFWCRKLLPWLHLPQNVPSLFLSASRPHRCAVCRSICDVIVEENKLIE